MRIPEKTIELNFCAQLLPYLPHGSFWFGLTQAQEKRAGFDACSRVAGTLLVFQFKASNEVLRSGSRRFRLEHEQMRNLQSVAARSHRAVYYVFPLLGTTPELPKPPDLLSHSALLDVANIPLIDPPTQRNGRLRKSGRHYADVVKWAATIHSKPTPVKVLPASELRTTLREARGLPVSEMPFRELSIRFSGGAYAAFLPSRP